MNGRAEADRGRAYWLRAVGCWRATAIIAWEILAGSVWDLSQIQYVRSVFAHLN